MADMKIEGGYSSYGHIAGILMSDSTIPRTAGDPGHAGTFSFPVLHEVLRGFPFQDLVDIKKDHVDVLINCARQLEQRGVKFIAADCGLFGPFGKDMQSHLKIPFIGSAIDVIPMLQHHCPVNKKIGIITGDTHILKPGHLKASGVEPDSVVISGMENSNEFTRVVIEKAGDLDVEKMREGVVRAARELEAHDLNAVILECTNLISFRADVQGVLNTPVYDLVSLIEFYASGFLKKSFRSQYI